MIDFETAAIFNEEEMDSLPPCIVRPDGATIRTLWNSPWASRGCMKSFRDDVHQVLVSVAMLIYGNEYWQYWENISDNESYKQLWEQHRFNGEIFELQGMDMRHFVLDSLSIPGAALADARPLFRQLGRYVVNLGSTQRPDHDFMVTTIRAIMDLVR